MKLVGLKRTSPLAQALANFIQSGMIESLPFTVQELKGDYFYFKSVDDLIFIYFKSSELYGIFNPICIKISKYDVSDSDVYLKYKVQFHALFFASLIMYCIVWTTILLTSNKGDLSVIMFLFMTVTGLFSTKREYNKVSRKLRIVMRG